MIRVELYTDVMRGWDTAEQIIGCVAQKMTPLEGSNIIENYCVSWYECRSDWWRRSPETSCVVWSLFQIHLKFPN